jgi:hypothetical protein
MLSTEEVTTSSLKNEIAKAEGSLAKIEQALAARASDDNHDDDAKTNPHEAAASRPLESLQSLQDAVECLELAKDVAQIVDSSNIDNGSLMSDVKRCEQLGSLLCRTNRPLPEHNRQTSHDKLLHTLYTEEYLPLYKYCRCKLTLLLRKYLRNLGYPSVTACANITAECASVQPNQESVAACCLWSSRLQNCHSTIMSHMGMESHNKEPSSLDVVVEFCRPLVEKVRFHFLEAAEDRVSSMKPDRLPEWIFNYIREHGLEFGPWEMIGEGLGQVLVDVDLVAFQYLDQMARLGHYVLEQRDFFRNEAIIANPTLLASAIEQIFQFDTYLRSLHPRRPFGLAQALIAEDEDVLSWWLDRERESNLSFLLESTVSFGKEGLSPRAELFCAIIHSVQTKAALLVHPGPYVSHVGVPLCQHFLDAIHESATDLKKLLNQRKLVTTTNLEKNLLEWIELINGTKLAASTLLNGAAIPAFGSSPGGADHDLARVGRSLERLVDVLVDECATSLVETVLMERAKLASYLMRCSHVLMTSDPDGDDDDTHGLSADLQDTATIYSTIMSVCSRPLGDQLMMFAPASIQTNVTNRLADKFLEVALDAHGMTPDIHPNGAKVFARDMERLLGSKRLLLLSPFATRLMDVAELMMWKTRPMRDLKTALLGLTHSFGESNTLNIHAFSKDGTLIDEAMYMLRAKGFSCLHLEDAVSILNRRTDCER